MFQWIFAVFLTAPILIRPAFAAPASGRTYFSAAQFADCLSEQMASYFTSKEFDDRIRRIQETRMTLAERASIHAGINCEFFCPGQGLSGASLMRPLGCWMNNQVSASLMLHSGPLILTNPKFSHVVRPEMSLHQIRDAVVRETREPLQDWLRRQPEKSVSHWQLFMQAKKIFGDPFVALGAIGDLFENEREWCQRKATGKYKCELAHRMKPLITPTDDDPVGRNYHFWAHLNMVWKYDGGIEKMASYALEILKDGDVDDHAANLLGIDSSTKAFEQTKRRLAPLGRYLTSMNGRCEL